jgi:parallel beta-helix repeat protein
MSGRPATHASPVESAFPRTVPRLSRAVLVRGGIVAATVALIVAVPVLLAGARPPSPGPGAGAAAVASTLPASSPSAGPSATPWSPEPTPPPGTNPEIPASALETSSPAPPHTGTATPAPTPAPVRTPAPTPTPVVVTGTALYVATNGSDSNPGTLAAPLRTIARAAAIARSGMTIWIRGGTYAGFDVTRSGLTFASYTGETAVISDGSRDDVIQFSGVTSGALKRLVVQGSTVQYGSGVKINKSSGVTVSASTIRNNRTFGIVIVSSSNVHISGNTITGNADGIEERYAGNGVVISNNKIYSNTKMVDSGRGMEGINFYKSTGAVTVTGNSLWNNGTHFEVYGASNLNITGNVTWNGQIMETGTDGPACDNNRFTRNIGYKGSGYPGDTTSGMILRCASHNLIAQNTLDGFDLFAFDVVDGTTGVAYGGSIAGLRILNNIVVGGRAFSIDSALPSSVVIDYTLVYNAGSTAVYGNHVAYVKGKGNFDTLSAFHDATGYEAHGVAGDPLFVNRSGRDYRLGSGSPAIDRGLVVLSDGYAGSAPDLGRFEYP